MDCKFFIQSKFLESLKNRLNCMSHIPYQWLIIHYRLPVACIQFFCQKFQFFYRQGYHQRQKLVLCPFSSNQQQWTIMQFSHIHLPLGDSNCNNKKVYRKVTSKNMCYNSGNQKFGIIKSWLVTPPFVLKQNRHVLKQHKHVLKHDA